jgi:cell division protein FtsI (penicillin-binding protein 3)
VELPGETNGILKTPDDPTWSIRSKPTIAIGQEVAVSALQVVEASTALTNGGNPVHLTLVSRITNAQGDVTYEHKPQSLGPVMSPLTANYVLSYMETGVESGIGRHASLGDIPIGVKTGTAQMIDPATNTYSDTDFLSDVISIFPIDTPVEEPKIILYIVLTKARGNVFASAIVAPVIAEAANTIIDHLGYVREKAPSFAHTGAITVQGTAAVDIRGTMPDLRGTPKRLLTPLLGRPDLEVLIRGDGYVVRQSPPAGTPITEGQRIELDLE